MKSNLLHQPLEIWAKKQPNKTALIFQKKTVSYSELNMKADCFASYLLNSGIKKEDLILIMADKSIEVIYSIFGVLKAGGVYIPIDSETPDKRLQHIIEKSKPKIIITEKKYELKLKNVSKDSLIIVIDQFDFSGSFQKKDREKILSNQLCYIIFTSGTTGIPKGVMLKHDGVTNTINALINRYYINKNSRLLQFSSLGFDSSVAEIFSVISAGGTLILAPTSEVKNLKKLTTLLREQKVTTVTLPPALLNHMDFSGQTSLVTIISAGDQCSIKLANRLYKQIPHFINAYGPTECSICISTYEVISDLVDIVPIGIPIPGIKMYVLDDKMRKVRAGEKGELYVGGKGVAAGYLDEATKNKLSFVSSPFDKDLILYKTNDRVVQHRDGNYVFMGRTDSQVKIRGNRVEVEEIEKILSEFEGVNNVAVCIDKNEHDEALICCYYTSNELIEQKILREHISAYLPRYMVPQKFVHIETMPLNSSGKIDRSRLSTHPHATQKLKIIDSISEDSSDERRLMGILKRLLNLTSINMNNDFFDLGGDSLLAMQLISEIGQEFNIDIALELIFEHSKLSEILGFINEKATSGESKMLSLKSGMQSYPLGDTQRMFWVAYKIDENLTVNNITTVVSFNKNIDVTIAQQCLHHIVNSHSALRTNFVEKQGIPFQIIHNTSDIHIKTIRIEKPEGLNSQLHALSSKVFKLETDHLLEVTLLTLGDRHTKLVFVIHHIIADGYSIEIMLSDFFDAYRSIELGKQPANIIQLKQYSDLAMFQQTQVYKTEVNSMKTFWKDYLFDSNSYIDIPTDHPRQEMKPTFEGKILEREIDSEIFGFIRESAKKLRITPYLFLFSVFNVLLYRISNQSDVVIGTPFNIRKKDFENSVGPFINTIAIRSRFNEDLTFNQYIINQKSDFLKILKNQEYPFSQLVEDLKVERDLATNPIFNVMFDYFKENSILNTNLNLKHEVYDNGTSKFDLTFSAIERTKNPCLLRVEYSTQLYEMDSIQRLVDCFLEVLISACSNPERKISDLKILPDKERDIIINSFNNTKYAFDDRSFIEIFESRVIKTPKSVAVKCGNQNLTYGELNAQSNRLARKLRMLGVGTDQAVGVLLPRSPGLITSIVAIWKAGGVYVPIETEFPPERIREMVSGSGLKVALSEQKYNYLLENNCQIINLDEENLASFSDSNLKLISSSSSLAYIIFTSGSTGKPKGVMIEHRGMMNHLFIMIDYFHLSNKSKIAQNASHCFDISIWQLTCSLLIGATTVIYPKDVVLSPPDFLEAINMDQISILEVVPSFLNTLLEFIEIHGKERYPFANLRYLLPTGETVKASLIRRWFNIYPDIPITNAYGPAEASDDTNFYLMTDLPQQEIRSIPVGKPLKNIKVYIVDAHMNLVPMGIYGEICISGIAVGRGYINNTSKTKESFINDPFYTKEDMRLYKTGDMGRWISDGNIEFVGRRDFQVKINGYRIELEEIESKLLQYPQIREVVVTAVETGEDSRSLVAYYTCRTEIPSEILRKFLLDRLPPYMTPSFFVQLEKMPLNNSGKIDRKLLPMPKRVNSVKKDEGKPLSKKEKDILRIWKKVLNIKNIKSTDNFFEIGGDSLRAIQIISLLKNEGYKITVKDIFTNQTVKDLAEKTLINNHIQKDRSTQGSFSLSPIQIDFFNQNYQNRNRALQAFWFDIKKIKVNLLSKALIVLQQRHESLRLRFSIGDTATQYYANDATDILSIYEVPPADESSAFQNIVCKNTFGQIDIENGPIIRASLVKYEMKYKILIAVHHLAIDILSWDFLVSDLEKIYLNLKEDKSVLPPPTESTYKDWVDKLKKYSETRPVEEDIPYWEEISKNTRQLIPITNRHAKAVRKQLRSIIFKEQISQKVQDYTIHFKKKTETILLALITTALARFSGTDNISFLIERHGRADIFDDIDISRTIGWFTNTSPFSASISQNAIFEETLEKVETTLNTLPSEGFSYGLIRYLRRQKDAANIRIVSEPQIVFNYLGTISERGTSSLFTNPRLVHVNQNDFSKKIEIDIYIQNERLIVEIRYSNVFYDPIQITELIDCIKNTINRFASENKLDKSPKVQFDLVSIDEERFRNISSRLS